MVEVVISIAAKVAEVLVVPIGKQICYPFKYNTNMEELKKQVQKLTDQREMVQHSVDEAKRKGQEIERSVEEWMKSVDGFGEKVVKPIIDKEDKAGKLCSFGFCSNMMTRYFLSKKAVKTTKDGISLLGEGTFQKVSYHPTIRRTKSVYTRGYEDFDSRMPVFEDIMKALADEDVNLIGVYGMGGVGKTTLVKRVAALAIEDKVFDEVVVVEVTQTPDIKSLQGQIADVLNLEFHMESLTGRAAQLRARLKKENSILLIFDNIWEKVDLDVVGIPFWNDEKPGVTEEVDEGGRNANKKKWRLLLTSRDLDILRNDMNTQKNFFIDILSHVEAMNLFWKIVDHSKEKADFNPIAVEIVRKCAGLPVAITTIGNALKNKDLSDWKNALQCLRNSNPKFIKGMETSVYSTIELSYNVLRPEEQSLFLLCSLNDFGFGLLTNDLIKYSMGLNLFKNVDTVEDARNRIHTLISNLKASCLLLDGNAKGEVKMHDIIHAVAVSIASSSDKLMFNIQNVTCIKEMLEDKLPKDSIALCYSDGDIKELPEILEFPNLKFLHLSPIELLSLQISDALFDKVKGLKVLHLTNFDLLSLPSSLCKITNLQTLCLDHCLIGDIAIIGELKKLEILSFLGSEIEQLSGEIGQLTRLRLLDLSNCSKLKVITPNVLSSLTRLEELYMGNSFDQWDVHGRRNASLVELKKLSNLTTLEIQILEAQIMPPDLFFGKLERYQIFIGDVWKWSDIYSTSRILKFKLNSGIFLSDGIKFLLNRVEDLYLDELKGVKNVLQELNGEVFQQLKHLHIQNAPLIQHVFQWFDQLTVMPSYCQTLAKLTVEECAGLEFLFSYSMVKSLTQLQELEIRNCKSMKEIFKTQELAEEEREVKMIFSKLSILVMKGLPKLTRIGCGNSVEFPSLRELLINDCPNLKTFISGSMLETVIISKEQEKTNSCTGVHPLYDKKVSMPSLHNLILEYINSEVIWNDQFLAASFYPHNLTRLLIHHLCNLKYLLLSYLVDSLVHLNELEIVSCKLMEVVVVTEVERPTVVLFPVLHHLYLEDLPKLTRFCDLSGNLIDLSSLSKLCIKNCPTMKTFISNSLCANMTARTECCTMNSKENLEDDIQPFFDEKVRLSSLKELIIEHMDNLRKVWHDQLYLDSFCKLERLRVARCNKLFNVFPSNMLGRLQSLEVLFVIECDSVEEIFELEALESKKTHGIAAAQLKTLRLCNLPKLKHVWNMDSQVILSFQSLHLLSVHYCDSLKSLFPAIIAGGLEQLEKLYVRNCMMEEIISKKDELEAVPKFVFPQLTELKLLALSRLKSYHSGLYISKWPMLQRLLVWRCNEVEMLASEFQIHGESQHDIPSGQPLFLVDKIAFPSLNRLELNWNCLVKEMSYGKFSEYSCKLNYLKLAGPFMESAICPSCFLCKLPKVISLAIYNGCLKELFLCEGLVCQEKHSEVPSKLRFLELHVLSDSLLWEAYSEFDKVSRSLETLQVSKCHNIRSLVPFTTSFKNLTTLKLSNCDELLNLVASSTAKSLVQLTRMEITECKKIEEIIAHNEDEAEDCIIFNQLKYLGLNHLPSLKIFYSGSCTIKFPSLREVAVKQCPNMKNFSRGDLSTPRLHTLQIGETEGCWESDLNTSIAQQNIEKCPQEEEDETECEEDEMEYFDAKDTTDYEEEEEDDDDDEMEYFDAKES